MYILTENKMAEINVVSAAEKRIVESNIMSAEDEKDDLLMQLEALTALDAGTSGVCVYVCVVAIYLMYVSALRPKRRYFIPTR